IKDRSPCDLPACANSVPDFGHRRAVSRRPDDLQDFVLYRGQFAVWLGHAYQYLCLKTTRVVDLIFSPTTIVVNPPRQEKLWPLQRVCKASTMSRPAPHRAAAR